MEIYSKNNESNNSYIFSDNNKSQLGLSSYSPIRSTNKLGTTILENSNNNANFEKLFSDFDMKSTIKTNNSRKGLGDILNHEENSFNICILK